MNATKRLYRSRSDRQFAGVCGGLANYFNIDSTLVRLIFVVMSIMGGPGLILYVVLWMIMPEESQSDWTEHFGDKRKNDQNPDLV